MSKQIRLAVAAFVLAVLPATASAATPPPLHLVTTATPNGIIVRAVGTEQVRFTGTAGMQMTTLSQRSVRLEGVRVASGPSPLRLVARESGSPRLAILTLNHKRKPPPPPPPPLPPPLPPPPVRGAAAPAPPASYTVPAGAVSVSTSAAFSAELAKPKAHDIVLADGPYSSPTPFRNPNGDHVYAAHLGQAVLHAGLAIAGNYGSTGGLVQGLAFDITSAATVADNAIIDVWGPMGANVSVLDTTLDGHSVVGYGISVTNPEGFVSKRVVARNFTSDGISVDSYPNKLTFTRAPELADIDVANVSRATPRSANGTSEACIWLGTKVTLTRAKLRNCAWMGLWTGFNSVNALYTDIDVDQSPTGIYMEHFTTGSAFRNIHVGPGVRTGFNGEWADPTWNNLPASVDNVIEDSLIEASYVGVYLDEGTTRTTVRNSTFRGQSAAAIDNFKGVGNSFSGNDYSGIKAGAVAVSTAHL